MYKFWALLTLLVGLTACSSDNEVTTPDPGYDYFPLSIGDVREYSVFEVNYFTAGPDTSRYFLKEEVTDTIVNRDVVTYILERSVRNSAEDPWEVDSVWNARRTIAEAIQVENNVPIVKIQFPVTDGQRWDSNIFNTRDEFPFQSELIASDSLEDEALRVIIEDIPENVVKKDLRSEYYARGIGLISRDFDVLNFCTSGCDGAKQIESGRFLNQKLINYDIK